VGLTVRLINRTGTQVGYSDPLILFGIVSDHKLSYARDNSVISPKSSYRRRSLPPRCWIAVSWRCSRFQGLVCSTIKTVRDLSSERCKTVRLISAIHLKLLVWIFLYARTSDSFPLVFLLFIMRRVATDLSIITECI